MSSLHRIAVFLCGMLAGAAACLLLFVCFRGKVAESGEQNASFPDMSAEEIPPRDTTPVVWYISGWKTEDDSQDEPMMILKRIFPGSQVTHKPWKSNDIDFLYSSRKADIYADEWAGEIKKMNPFERERMILVGHSLGAKIVLRVMAQMRDWGLHVRQGILLGAAENNDSPDIRKAMYASQLPVINIWNRQDKALRMWYAKATDPAKARALGAYGYYAAFHPAYFRQYRYVDLIDMQQETKARQDKADHEMSALLSFLETAVKVGHDIAEDIFIHDAKNYLSFLEKEYPLFLKELPPMKFEMTIDQDRESWEEVDSYSEENEKTLMEYNRMTKQYRVVSPNNVVICEGGKAICENVFGSATEWDDSTSLTHVQDICRHIPELSQQPQRIRIELDDRNREWKTVRETHSWLLQRAQNDAGSRIVDPFDYERANGSEPEMKALFDQLEKMLDPVSETGSLRE